MVVSLNMDEADNKWFPLDIIDLDAKVETCQSCGKEHVRFIHVLGHDKHPNLRVGFRCAQKLCGDTVGPTERENKLRAKSSRRAKWLLREWKITKKGGHILELEPHTILVFESKFKLGTYSFFINHVTSKKYYPSKNEAKLAAFEAFENGQWR